MSTEPPTPANDDEDPWTELLGASLAQVPEPTSLALLSAGLVALGIIRRRSRPVVV